MTEPEGRDGSNVAPSGRPVRKERPLVGREAECRVLDEIVRSVLTGLSGSCVFLGEPGVGKTRLLEYAASSGVTVIKLVGIESEFSIGFAALHRLLLPFRDRFAGVPVPQGNALLTTFGALDQDPPPRFLLGLATLSVLAAAAKEAPFICLIDDAQWLDQESLEVLSFVARRVYADSVGIVFAGRQDDEALHALKGLPTHHVQGLDRAASLSLLNSARTGVLSSLVAARIVAEGNGNPLAMLEVLGQLTSEQLAGRLPLPRQLPAGRALNAHYLRQLEELPQETRSFLVLASTMSTDDPSTLWRAAELLGLNEEAADAALDSDILTITEQVTFRHPLIRSAVYDAAEPRQRRLAHTAMATIAELDDDPDLAAWHRAAAMTTPNEGLAADLERSARRAENRGGRLAQARFLGRAAELSPEPKERSVRLFAAAEAYLAAGDGILAEALLDKAAPWLEAEGRFVDVQRLRASIAVFFSRHDEVPALLLDALGQVDQGNVALIRSMLFDALQAGLVARDRTVGVTATGIAERVLAFPFDTETANSGRDFLLQGLATRLAVGYAPAVPLLKHAVSALFPEDEGQPAVLSTVILGWFAADDLWDEVGRKDMFERAVAFGRQHGDLGALRIALAGKCVGHCWTGDMQGAEQCYFEAAEVSALIGIPPPATTGVLLELRAWQGREQESRETAALTAQWGAQRGAEVLEIFSWFGLTVLDMGLGKYEGAFETAVRIFDRDPPGFGSRVLPEVIEAGVRTGQVDISKRALERLADRAQASGSSWALGILARSQALLAPDTDAEPLYDGAISLLSQTSLRIELARARLLYGQWLRRQKRRKDAQAQLFIAFEIFDSMGARAFGERARNELHAAGYHEVEMSRGRAVSGLTSQEAQVARLASAGATNSEIATQMFLTTSTVEYHLSKIFKKLAITSRRQLSQALGKAWMS